MKPSPEELREEFYKKFSSPDGLTKIGCYTVSIREMADHWLPKVEAAYQQGREDERKLSDKLI